MPRYIWGGVAPSQKGRNRRSETVCRDRQGIITVITVTTILLLIIIIIIIIIQTSIETVSFTNLKPDLRQMKLQRMQGR